jgi:methylmalonyl-CoA/ethylmalonyl-CoA epimerase
LSLGAGLGLGARGFLDHVSVLVRDLPRACEPLRRMGLALSEPEEFAAEGTREVYVGVAGSGARILLQQAISDGPYLRALQKRGPGLHHLAIATEDLGTHLKGLEHHGWRRHEASAAAEGTAWLFLPGAPFWVEVFRPREWREPGQWVLDALELPFAEELETAVAALGSRQLVRSQSGGQRARCGGVDLDLGILAT